MLKKKLACKTITVLIVPAALLILYAYGFFNTEENFVSYRKLETHSEQPGSPFKPVSIKDSVGNKVIVKRKIERIVVSYYGCAEVLRSLSYAGKIVGVGETIIDRPFYFPKLSSLPSTGKTTFNEIEQILKLNPDTVILRTRAGDTETRNRLLGVNPNLNIIQMDFYKAENHISEVTRIAKILNREKEAEKYLNFYKNVLKKISSKLKNIPDSRRPRVYLESTQNFKTGAPGSSWHEKILTAGGKNIYADEPVPLPIVTSENIISKNPDIIVKVGGWGVDDFGGYGVNTLAEMKLMKKAMMNRPAWDNIKAVKENRVWVLYNDILGGPAHFVGIAYLAKMINPELFKTLNPQAIHQEYLDKFQRLDFDLEKRGAFVWPELK